MRGLVGSGHSIVEYKHDLVHALHDLVHALHDPVHALKVSCFISIPGQLHLYVVLDD